MGANGDVTAEEIVERLLSRYNPKEWLVFHELREGAGFQDGGPSLRTIDFAAVHRWSGHGHKFVCVEVKITLADFRREIANAEKRRAWHETAHEFWFAAPRGVIPLEELPDGCGLVETYGSKLRTRRAAPSKINAPGPDAGMWMMMVRQLDARLAKQKREEGNFATFAGRPIGLTELRELADLYGALPYRVAEMERQIRARILTEQRKENLASGRWAAVQREWEWTLRSLFGRKAVPEEAEKAMKVIQDLAPLRRIAEQILEVVPAKHGEATT